MVFQVVVLMGGTGAARVTPTTEHMVQVAAANDTEATLVAAQMAAGRTDLMPLGTEVVGDSEFA